MRSTDLFFGPRILFGGDDDNGSSGGGGGGSFTSGSSHRGERQYQDRDASAYGREGSGNDRQSSRVSSPSGTDNDASVNDAAAQADAQAAENRGVRSGMLNTNTGNSWVDANLNMDVGYEQGFGEKMGSMVPGLSFSHKENPNTMAEGPTEPGFNPGEVVGAFSGIPFASSVIGYAAKKAGLTYGPQAPGIMDRVVDALPAGSTTQEFPGQNRQDNDRSTGTGGLLSGVSNGSATSGTGSSGETPSNNTETDIVSNSVGAGLPSPTERFRGDRYLNGRWVRNATTGQLEWAAA